MIFTEITKEEYEEYAKNHPLRSFFQTTSMAEVSSLKMWK